MTSVILRPNESQDGLLKRFRKKVVKSGVLSTVRRKRWFISKSELRRVEKKKAIRRIKRRLIGKIIEKFAACVLPRERFREIVWLKKKIRSRLKVRL